MTKKINPFGLRFFLTVFLTLAYVTAWAQSVTVTGTVKDENGDPLMGVTVRQRWHRHQS